MSRKYNGKAAIELLTKTIREHNELAEQKQLGAAMKLRGNPKMLAKRLIYDFRNAYNGKRQKNPAIIASAGKYLLCTCPSLLRVGEEQSMSPRTAKNALRKLEELEILIAGWKHTGNDLLIELQEDYMLFEDIEMPRPDRPPDRGGKADSEGLVGSRELERLKRRFNRKHS